MSLHHYNKALEDAEGCIVANPSFVKGHFRKGLALHAMKSFGEAVVALEKAEKLDPKNKQVKDALRMAEYMGRKAAMAERTGE